MPKLETLFCKNGQHNWTRMSARARKPSNCSEHPKPASQTVSVTTTADGWMSVQPTTTAETPQSVSERLETLNAHLGLAPTISAGHERAEALYQAMHGLHERQNRRDRMRTKKLAETVHVTHSN